MKTILACFLLITFDQVYCQSPWVAEKSKGYFQLGYTDIGPYSDLFTKTGGSYPLTREVTDQTLQLYGEYGLGFKTSIITSIPFKFLKTGDFTSNSIPSPIPNEEGTFSTIGNIQLAARHNFISSKLVFSGQLMIELPTAGYDDATGLRGGLDALAVIPTVSFGMGRSKFYEYLSTGTAIRSNGYSSEWRLSGEFGYKIINRVYLIFVIDVVQSFENGDARPDANQLQTGLYLNNQSFFAYGLKTIIGFTDHVGVTGGVYGAGSGNLVAKSPSINAGFYYKL